MDKGYEVYRHVKQYTPELAERTRFVRDTDIFVEKLRAKTLTFDDLMTRLANCKPQFRGMPATESIVTQCEKVVRDAFMAATGQTEAFVLVLRVLGALATEASMLYPMSYSSAPSMAKTTRWKAPKVQADIRDFNTMFRVRFQATEFRRERSRSDGFARKTPDIDIELRFEKEPWPAPIAVEGFHRKYPMITVIDQMMARPDLLESTLTHFKSWETDAGIDDLASWAAAAVASSCLFSVEPTVFLHTAFTDLSA